MIENLTSAYASRNNALVLQQYERMQLKKRERFRNLSKINEACIHRKSCPEVSVSSPDNRVLHCPSQLLIPHLEHQIQCWEFFSLVSVAIDFPLRSFRVEFLRNSSAVENELMQFPFTFMLSIAVAVASFLNAWLIASVKAKVTAATYFKKNISQEFFSSRIDRLSI
ncbi:hypothetical protein Tcan_00151 [Toxocara canis]|uniref:Uncharacterized protein n=1 Tax=Toxocara canis TaxID=6265 RepID=A0A0B2UUT3_TOXCA|nr:hypothetical protein Tcan_00151 [Toxocara canis]